jgi:hypothetical protein
MDYTKTQLMWAGGGSQAIHGDGSLSILSLEDFLAQDDSLGGKRNSGPAHARKAVR